MDHLSTEIDIKVLTQYLPGRVKDKNKFAFAYKVQITNNSTQDVQLLNRYWLITDANGKNTEVSGEGVVGEQPLISSGKSFSYTSAAVLDTPVGAMQGHYEMQSAQGTTFNATISPFGLAIPKIIN